MKKTLATIAASVVIAGSSFAQNVGDKMPTSEYDLLGGRPLSPTVFMKIYGFQGIRQHAEAIQICRGKERLFAFYNIKTQVLYLDHDTDGLIDEVVTDPNGLGRTPIQDAPICKKGI